MRYCQILRRLSVLKLLMLGVTFTTLAFAGTCTRCGAPLPENGSGCNNISCLLWSVPLLLFHLKACPYATRRFLGENTIQVIDSHTSCLVTRAKAVPEPPDSWLSSIMVWANNQHGDYFQQYNQRSTWPDLDGIQAYLEEEGYTNQEVILETDRELVEQVVPIISTPNQLIMMTFTTMDLTAAECLDYTSYFLFETDSNRASRLLTDNFENFLLYTRIPGVISNLNKVITKFRNILKPDDVVRLYRYSRPPSS